MDRRIWATAGLAAAGGVLTLAVLAPPPAQTTTVTVSQVVHPTETAGPPPRPAHFGDGVWPVPTAISPGTYRTAGSPDPNQQCVWERIQGDIRNYVDTGLGDPGDTQTVTIQPDDTAFRAVSCGTWTKVG